MGAAGVGCHSAPQQQMALGYTEYIIYTGIGYRKRLPSENHICTIAIIMLLSCATDSDSKDNLD